MLKFGVIFLLGFFVVACVEVQQVEQEDETAYEVVNQEHRDLIIQGDYILPNQEGSSGRVTLKYDRIIFNKNSSLTTQGQNVSLVVGEVIAIDGGLIRSFPSGQKAADNQDGRHGGRIEMKINQLQGDLQFDLNGESGGDGLPGGVPDLRNKGRKGQKGADGLVTQVEISNGIGGVMLPHCQQKPADGFSGETGLEGYRGENGKNGGDTASLYLKIVNREMGQIFINRKVGAPGKGGLGGAGGEGGEGGDPGVVVGMQYVCPLAKAGAKGSSGKSGSPGQDGKEGHEQIICEEYGSAQRFCY